MLELDSRYQSDFKHLIQIEQLQDVCRPPFRTQTFDEVPLYSRLTQIAFLQGEPVQTQNTLLVRAAVRHLIESTKPDSRWTASTEGYLVMVSITDWWDYDDGGQWRETSGGDWIITPQFWIGNMNAPEMRRFRMEQPRSASSEFVKSALEDLPEMQCFEGWRHSNFSDPFLDRIYLVPAAEDVGELVSNE